MMCPTVVHHPAIMPAGSLQWLEAGIAWEVQLETEIARSPTLRNHKFAAWSLICTYAQIFKKQ